MADTYYSVTGGPPHSWHLGDLEVRRGMIVKPTGPVWNLRQLQNLGYIEEFTGKPDGLPRCEPCRCWFGADAYLNQHRKEVHEAPVKTIEARKRSLERKLAEHRGRQDELDAQAEALVEQVRRADAELAEARARNAVPEPEPIS